MENENNSLSDLAKLSDPAKVLIEKISDAIGAAFKPWQIRRIARSESDAAIIGAETEIKISEIERRGLLRRIQLDGLKQQNIENITAKAIDSLDDNANTQNMDNDWIVNFFDSCESISDIEMQNIWAKILSGEANKPKTYSKRTVNIVRQMSKEDADLFSHLCRFAMAFKRNRKNPMQPIIFGDNTDTIESFDNISLEDINHLESIGLISHNSTGCVLTDNSEIAVFHVEYYGNQIYASLPKTVSSLPIGIVSFSRAGHELYTICKMNQPIDGFTEYVKKHWERQGIGVYINPQMDTFVENRGRKIQIVSKLPSHQEMINRR